MSVTRLARITGIALAVPLAAAVAQTPPSSSPTNPPAATKSEPAAPQAMPNATPVPTPAEKSATAPAPTATFVGLSAKSSDGHNLGTVQKVMGPASKTGIGVKVGGFLGLGGHYVVLPEGKATRVGDVVQVSMTADEVAKLPKAEQQ
jgi:hypothetical protein